MTSKQKILFTLPPAILGPLVVAVLLLRPDGRFVAILGAIALVTLLISLKRLSGLIDERTNTSVPAQCPATLQQARIEPDFLLHRIIPAIEEILLTLTTGTDRPEGVDLRKQLRDKLAPILAEDSHLAASVEEKEVTVLLSDLRGFTTITENYSAIDVADMLNRYFTIMCEIIYRHGGIVDKFVGDSIMALFGVPHRSGSDVEHALCCAIEMQIAMNTFNKENKERSIPDQFMGIGINTGKALAGWVGSQLHSEYTVIGDEINLTSRIEAYTLRGQILIGSNTYTKAKDLIEVNEPMHISVKGKRDPLVIYELKALGAPYNLKVPDREVRKSLRIDVTIPFKFQICIGKIVSADLYDGRILNISLGGLLACTLTELQPHANIKFHLDPRITGAEGEDIYGKVIRVKKREELYEANIEFTAIDSKDSKAIKELINRTIDGSLP
jgi:adenylate cyclase